MRVGIGKKPEQYEMISFVLGKFLPEEKEVISAAEQRAAEAVLSIVKNGCERTMSEFNSSRKEKPKATDGEENAATQSDERSVPDPAE